MADQSSTTICKTFEYKLRPNAKFIAACEHVLSSSRFLYNCLLEQRISYYQQTGKSLNKFEQSRQITEARNEFSEMASVSRAIQTDVLDRLDKSYQAFFKRNAGFPRFKGQHRYHSFSQQIEKQRTCPLRGDKLHVPSVGTCRVRLSRPIEGRVKQLRITRRADGWFALLVCEIPQPKPLPKTGVEVGVDVGIKSFATLSTGESIENPRHLAKASDTLAKLQRRLSRKKRGSNNRVKARQKVALAHAKVARTRKDFHHKEAAKLVARFDRIIVEDLNIKGMVKNRHLSKAIADVAWSQFFSILASKAENAGRQFEKVNPRYSSMTCSRCGHVQKMPLAIRTFVCQSCEFVIDRDHNAAKNLVRRSTPEVTPVELKVALTKKQERSGSSRNKRQSSGLERVTATRARH